MSEELFEYRITRDINGKINTTHTFARSKKELVQVGHVSPMFELVTSVQWTGRRSIDGVVR